MPTYDYRCEACEKEFEIFHSMSKTRRKCPDCGELRLTRLIGPGSGFIFRGSGFYITDYRSDEYKKAKASDVAAGSSSSSDTPSGDTPDKGASASKDSSGDSGKSEAKSSSSKDE